MDAVAYQSYSTVACSGKSPAQQITQLLSLQSDLCKVRIAGNAIGLPCEAKASEPFVAKFVGFWTDLGKICCPDLA